MEEETKGLKGAVARLRAELHSLALGGAAIVVEVSPEQWAKLRGAYAAASDATELVLVADQVNGDVVFRLKKESGKQIQLDALGLQPPTIPGRVELLEKTLRALLEDDTRQITISARIGAQVNERLEALEQMLTPKAVAELVRQLREATTLIDPARIEQLGDDVEDLGKRVGSLESWRAMSP